MLRQMLRRYENSKMKKDDEEDNTKMGSTLSCPICQKSFENVSIWTHVENAHLAISLDRDVATQSTGNTNITESKTTRNLVRELEDMGFPVDWCRLAVQERPCNIVQASTWIVDHLDVLTKESNGDETSCFVTKDSEQDDENDIFDLSTCWSLPLFRSDENVFLRFPGESPSSTRRRKDTATSLSRNATCGSNSKKKRFFPSFHISSSAQWHSCFERWRGALDDVSILQARAAVRDKSWTAREREIIIIP